MTAPRKIRIRPGVFEDLPEDQYHGHKTSVSSSGIKTLLRSPLQFKHEREHPQASRAMDEGSVAHKLVLGKGAEFAVLDFENRRTNAYKEAEAEARAAGLIPLLTAQHEDAQAIAKSVLEHPVAGPLFTEGRAELSVFAKDKPTGVLRRVRYDWLREDGISIDLKTTAASAEPVDHAVGKTSLNYGYHVSAAYYIDTGRDAGLNVRGMVHVFVEKDAPHLVSVIQLDDEAIELGRRRYRRGLEIFRDCTQSGIWPMWASHHEPITAVGLPGYAFKEE